MESVEEEDVPCNPEDQIWRDESLSEDELRIQCSLVEYWRSDVLGKVNLTPDLKNEQPFVLEYLQSRMDMLYGLRLSYLEGTKTKEDPKRLLDRRTLKVTILRLVALNGFADWLKDFGIGEDHRLSPLNLFPKGAEQLNDGSPLAGLGAARSLPHYTSPWKNAILLSLVAEGSGADYPRLADYLDKHFPFVDRPTYCARMRESIGFLIGNVASAGGTLTPRHPKIRVAFQKDVSKVRADLEAFTRNSLVGEPAR